MLGFILQVTCMYLASQLYNRKSQLNLLQLLNPQHAYYTPYSPNLKELLPVAVDPNLNIINSSLTLQ